jgi:penicillin amidase
MIETQKTFTIDAMTQMLRDSLNTEAAEHQPLFRGWTSDDPALERARAQIAGWNGVMDRDSAAAAVYMAWQQQADMKAVAKGDRSAVTAALAKASSVLTASQGADPTQWRWGRMNRSEFPHPVVSAFDVPGVERNGGAGTVNAIGAVYRLVTNFADPDASLVTIGPGVSGQPGSPYYRNLLDLWGRNEFFTLLYTPAAVENGARHRLILVPGS